MSSSDGAPRRHPRRRAECAVPHRRRPQRPRWRSFTSGVRIAAQIKPLADRCPDVNEATSGSCPPRPATTMPKSPASGCCLQNGAKLQSSHARCADGNARASSASRRTPAAQGTQASARPGWPRCSRSSRQSCTLDQIECDVRPLTVAQLLRIYRGPDSARDDVLLLRTTDAAGRGVTRGDVRAGPRRRSVGPTEVADVVSATPQIARAMVNLHRRTGSPPPNSREATGRPVQPEHGAAAPGPSRVLHERCATTF